MTKKTLIVGAGLTGAAISSFLSDTATMLFSNHIWEKARNPGGRMTTKSLGSNEYETVDIGAQYITKKDDNHAKIYDTLVESGILKPLNISYVQNAHASSRTQEHFIAPLGTSSIVQSFLDSGKEATTYHGSTHLTSLNIVDTYDDDRDTTNKGTKIWAATSKDGTVDHFDVVILTLPVPQILQIKGDIEDRIAPVKESLNQVKYSTRYVMALQYNSEEAMEIFGSIPWSVKYVNREEEGSDCICYMSIDAKKRGLDLFKDDKAGDKTVTLLVHASKDFSIANGAQVAKAGIPHEILDKVKFEMQESIQKLIPGLASASPSNVHMHRWLYSQVTDRFIHPDECQKEEDAGCFVADSDPPLILAGDAFSTHGSKFDGCIQSALSVKHVLVTNESRK
jgi:renalase